MPMIGHTGPSRYKIAIQYAINILSFLIFTEISLCFFLIAGEPEPD